MSNPVKNKEETLSTAVTSVCSSNCAETFCTPNATEARFNSTTITTKTEPTLCNQKTLSNNAICNNTNSGFNTEHSTSQNNGKLLDKDDISNESSQLNLTLNEISIASNKLNICFDLPSSDEEEPGFNDVNHTRLDFKNDVPNSISTSISSNLTHNESEAIKNSLLNHENSFDTKSSTENAFRSEESLWSEDSTISIFDSPTINFKYLNRQILRSSSDSQIYITYKLLTNNTKDESEDNDDNDSQSNKSLSENDINKCNTYKSIRRNPNATNFRIKSLENSLSHENGLNSVSSGKLTRLLENLSKDKSIRKLSLNTDYSTNSNDQIHSNNNNCEDNENDEQPPPRIRRCSSLKSGKTPPDTPRKKIVRFADVLGLDLADVRTFLDEIPKVPNSAYSDLIYDDSFEKDLSPVQNILTCWNFKSNGLEPVHFGPEMDRKLVPMFQQPNCTASFLDVLRKRFVTLEHARVEDSINFCVRGIVRVLNLDFHKSVHIRYTLNTWNNFSDMKATYVPDSCDGLSDTFSFTIYCHTLKIRQSLEFAVSFQCKGMQYWDNNNGANYCFQCVSNQQHNINYSPVQITNSTAHNREWESTFY